MYYVYVLWGRGEVLFKQNIDIILYSVHFDARSHPIALHICIRYCIFCPKKPQLCGRHAYAPFLVIIIIITMYYNYVL